LKRFVGYRGEPERDRDRLGMNDTREFWYRNDERDFSWLTSFWIGGGKSEPR
jgi:hypothetical protein